ncbi:amidohydrolase [Stakelama tenebrarum]|uniref:Amidohydrolase n=1 Tax=Stakelama tenebrarum TaxID=2711215 RepID=A0A6G6YAR7_9SPHN|nr:amidohydrolase [Sphingosinithalassobacter tenebrarum]QIG82009.1 amidohydrolase [Sphingosinithalassobacter tenebrarum]
MMRLLLALAMLIMPAAAFADGIIYNVNGLTLDEDGNVVRFNAMIVGSDGRVVKLFDLDRRDDFPEGMEWRADMEGRTLLPGMIDGHGHVMGLGFQLSQLNLTGTQSLDAALAQVGQWAGDNSARWIVGRGWNQEIWGLGRFPTAQELDSVTGDRPTVLDRVDGHALWVNSAALQAAGITKDTPDPAGGRIERDAQGNPIGILVDAAMNLIRDHVPQPTPRESNAAFLAAQRYLLAQGVTATADMGTTVEDWLLYRRMGDIGLLEIRIMSYGHGVDTALEVGGQGPTPWLYGDRLRMGGIKLYADGALGSRGAWLKADYADAPGQTGLGFLSDDQLGNLMVRGAMDNFQIAVHAIGDRANSQVLDVIDELVDTFDGDRRWRIEHAQIVDPADLPRFGKHGIIASMQPVHQTSDMAMAEARLGPDRLAGAYAWKSMIDNGSLLVFGSDFPVEDPKPFIGWAVAVSRQDADLRPFGGWQPQEIVTREQAWAAYTINAAYAGFAEDKVGRLAPGMQADFIIVDRDPLNVSARQLRETQVLETWIGGERVWKLGEEEPN